MQLVSLLFHAGGCVGGKSPGADCPVQGEGEGASKGGRLREDESDLVLWWWALMYLELGSVHR